MIFSGEQNNYLPQAKAEAIIDRETLTNHERANRRSSSITIIEIDFIIRSPIKFVFNEYLREAKRSAIFRQERSQEEEKCGFIYA